MDHVLIMLCLLRLRLESYAAQGRMALHRDPAQNKHSSYGCLQTFARPKSCRSILAPLPILLPLLLLALAPAAC